MTAASFLARLVLAAAFLLGASLWVENVEYFCVGLRWMHRVYLPVGILAFFVLVAAMFGLTMVSL